MPFDFGGSDNFIEFLVGRDDVARCPACEVHTHPFAHGFPNKKIPKKYDVSHCFEGFNLVSPRVKQFLEEHCTSPVEYHETGGGYFILRPSWSIFFDLTVEPDPETGFRFPTLAKDFCETCGRYNARHGAVKGLLPGPREVGPFDMFRSGQEMGPFMQKNFTLIVGDGLAEALKSAKFRGAGVSPITT